MVFGCPVFAVAVCFRWFCSVECLFGWLNVFNAELSLKTYRRGPISQEMEEAGGGGGGRGGGDYT